MIEFSPLGPVAAALKRRRKTELTEADLAPSAVLVPIFVDQGELGVLFIRRTDRVERHKGEYCFPGGFAEPEDASLLETALRESAEEVGLAPSDIRILGELDDVRTRYRVKIAPYVGTFPYPYAFAPSEDEVEAIVPIALDRLLAPEVRTIELWRAPDGEARAVTFYRVDGHVIWGATARILDQFMRTIGRLP